MIKKLHYSLLFITWLTVPATTLVCYNPQEHPEFPLCTQTQSITLTTIYGALNITEPVLIELLESRPLQRLKEIYQLGIWRYSHKDDQFTRYDHSVGVLALVRLKGGSLREQIAALLHDVSHTVFSHVGAFFFVTDSKDMDEFQDNLHAWYIAKTGLADILKKHGFTVEDILPKHKEFKRLEQDLPQLCADRIDYNIRGAVWDDLITPEQATQIVRDLEFTDGTWYFTSPESARLLASASLDMTVGIWGSAENFVTAQWLTSALKRSAQLGIITKEDVYFGTDTAVWQKMLTSNDSEILEDLHKIMHSSDYFELNETWYDELMKGKFRGLNPLVKTEQGFQHLLEIDQEYVETYQTTKETMLAGWHVHFIT
jgi:hypothetical protein